MFRAFTHVRKMLFLKASFFIITGCFSVTNVRASIYCPMDVTIFCNDDIDDTSITGYPVIFNHDPALLKYKDVYSGQQCYGITVSRTWFIDINGNQLPDATEPSCAQLITVENPGGGITVNFPPNREYTCKQDINNEKPTWIAGPCDVLGVSQSDRVFEVSDEACYKIFRTFTVINWCTYKPGTQGWNGEGIWTHTQIIKVIENTKPVFSVCEEKVLNTDSGCQATFSISNSASDDVSCGEQLLYWTAEIDLWGNGNVDYVYGFNQPAPYFLAPVKNDENVTITLPEKVGIGNHKVVWKVRDACGNYSTCQQAVKVRDLKKPIPVMHNVLYASFEGPDATLKITPDLFNVKSADNCTESRYLKLSFSSSVTDTVRVVDCNNAGIQEYRIYVTDFNGNQEYAAVTMVVFDNGSCATGPRIAGRITEPNGLPISQGKLILTGGDENTSLEATSDNEGVYVWNEVALYKNSVITPSYVKSDDQRIDIADFKILQNYLLGNDKLKNFEWMAADLDGDHRIRIKDLELLKAFILSPEMGQFPQWTFAANTDTIRNEKDLVRINHSLPLAKSDGSIAFTAVRTGDISGTNGETTNTRNKFVLIEDRNESALSFTVAEDILLEGCQIFLHLPNVRSFLNIKALGGILDNSWYTFDQSSNTLRILIDKSASLKKGEALFGLDFGNANSIPESCAVLEGSYMLKPGCQLLPIGALQSTKNEYTWIYPNPSSGEFQMQQGVEVINVQDVMGKNTPYEWLGQQLQIIGTPGMYSVRIKTPAGPKSIKVVKL